MAYTTTKSLCDNEIIRSALGDPYNNDNRDFRCDICNKYLSIAPILFHKSVGKLCGRCFENGETKKFPDVTFESQTVYEAVARHILFPCSFQAKGCTEILDWALVSKHEAACSFRDNTCPFGQDEFPLQETKCEWKGNDQNIFHHLMHRHDTHFSEILKISSPASEEPKNTILLSQFMDIPVVAILFVTNKPENLYFHMLMDIPFAQCEMHTYDLEVTDGIDKCKIVFAENKVVPLCGRSFTANSLEHGLNIGTAVVEGFLRSKCFNFNFKIKSKQSNPFKEESDLSSIDNNIFDANCASCENTLIQDIYLCEGSHNNCGDCYGKILACKCGEKLMNSRNHALENLSEISLHPCGNRGKGCSKVMKSEALDFHLRNCELTVKKCVVIQDCAWSGINRDMMDHVKELHNVIELNKKYPLNAPKGLENACTFLDGKLFVLDLKSTDKRNLSIKVKCLGIETCKYRFEFAIFSGKQNLTCCHFCVPLIYDDKKKVDKDSGVAQNSRLPPQVKPNSPFGVFHSSYDSSTSVVPKASFGAATAATPLYEEGEPGRIIYPENLLSQLITDREKTYFKLNIFQ